PINGMKTRGASFRLNARTSRHTGFCFGWTPPQNPEGQKRPHRRALRATPVFKTMNLAYFFCVNLKKWEFIFKDGGRA
ncbi:hypothetical protein ACEA62_23295, partial [Escherichia coli]